MNWDRVDNWKQFTGKVKEKWGKLTDDDIAQTWTIGSAGSNGIVNRRRLRMAPG